MRHLTSLLLLLSALTFPAIAVATEGQTVSNSTYIQAFFALLFVVALLFGAAWLARKLSGGKGFGQGGMKIVGGVALGPRERIVLIEADDTWLVIGIVPGQIRTLHRMPKSSIPGGTDTPAAASFADWLTSIAERRREQP